MGHHREGTLEEMAESEAVDESYALMKKEEAKETSPVENPTETEQPQPAPVAEKASESNG